MKRNTVVVLGIVAALLVVAALTIALITATRESDESKLHIHILSAQTDTNGSQIVTFLVTNANSKTFPWLATTTPDGQAPYYVIETKTEEGWRRTTPFTNYWFSHHLLAGASWEFQVSLASEQAHRLTLFYTVGERDRGWLQRQGRDLLKNLTLVKDKHELRSAILQANPIGAADRSQPVRQETNRTSAAAGSGQSP